MTVANYKCPSCNGRLHPSGEPDTFECGSCGNPVKEAVAENQESLQHLAESDLSCAWIAEQLLKTDGGGE